MLRGVTLLSILLAIAVSLAVFQLKYEVQSLEGELQSYQRDIDADREAIHVLKAEWAHLNDPQRLRGLVERHLDLHPLVPGQIGTWDRLPERGPGLETGWREEGK